MSKENGKMELYMFNA